MKPEIRELLRWLARHVLYVAIMLTTYGAVRLDARAGDTPRPPADRHGRLLPETPAARLARLGEIGKFNEDGVVEALELAMLLSIVLTCGALAVGHPEVRAVALLFGGWLGLAAIREQDQWFDQIFHGAWMVPAGLVAAGMAVYAWKARSEICRGLVAFVRTPGWGFFVSGGLMALVFARLMGKKALWYHLVDAPRLARNLKNMVEEGIETAGYALLLCGLVEALAGLRRRIRETPAAPASAERTK